MFEVNEGAGSPEFLFQFLPCHQLAGPLEQQRQDLKGLTLEPFFRSSPVGKFNWKTPKRMHGREVIGSAIGEPLIFLGGPLIL
jgi:hypothetical protein